MLDQLLDSSSSPKPASRALVGLSVSFGAHALAFGALVAGAFLAVGTIHRPDARLGAPERLIFFQPPPAAAAAAPLGSRTTPERHRREPPRQEPSGEMVQPEVVPGEISREPAGEEAYDDEEYEEGVPSGDPLGIPGGIPEGRVGGILNGDPSGVVGGHPEGFGREGPMPDPDREIIALSGEVREPERIHHVPPDYPEAARMARLEGRVVLTLVIGRGGSVEHVTVVSGNALFRRAAVEAVRQWRYRPALQSGRPVRISMLVIVEFSLR